MKRNRWKLCSLFAIILFALPQFALPVLAQDTVGEVGFAMEYYTVKFDSMGGSSVASIKDVPYGSTIKAPSAPTKKGMAFDGWFKDQTRSDEWVFNRDVVEKNITLYAKWKESGKSSAPSSGKTSDTSKQPVSSPPIPASRVTSRVTPVPPVPASTSSSSRAAGGTVPDLNVPTQGGIVGDVGTPPRVTPTPAAEEDDSVAEVDDEPVPEVELDTDNLDPNDSPLSSLMASSQWALANLLIAIGNILLAMWVLFTVLLRNNKVKIILKMVSIAVGVINALVFFIFERFAGKMVFIDLWTLVMLAAIIIQATFIVVSLRAQKTDQNKEEMNLPVYPE